MNSNTAVRFRLWVDKDNMPFLGLGRIILLENIQKYGSIAKAAHAISMSYRKAWQLVESMNRLSVTPLVIKQLGGKNGGSSMLTPTGLNAIEQYYSLHKKVEIFINDNSNNINL